MKKTLTAAMMVTTLALAGACGGGGDERPTKADISKAITAKDSVFGTTIPKKSADCVAGVIVDSKLSDKAVKAIAKGDKGYDASKDDAKALTGLTSKLGGCITK